MPKWTKRSIALENGYEPQPIADADVQNLMAQTPIAEHFKPMRLLGQGAYGKVYLALCSQSPNEQYVAIKKIKTENALDLQDVQREIWYLQQVRNQPHLCQMHSAYIKHRSDGVKAISYIVMEVYSGSLRDLIEKGNTGISFESTLQQLTTALDYLHQLQIVHRDLSAGNIFVKRDDSKAQRHSLVIGDFGLARQFPDRRPVVSGRKPKSETKLLAVDSMCKTLTSRVTTREYRAPEIFLESTSYTASIDMWSLGVVLYFVATGKEPFDIKRNRPSSTIFAEKIWPHYNNPLSNPESAKQPKNAGQLAASVSLGPPDFLLDNDHLAPLEVLILSQLLRLAPSARLTAAQLSAQYLKAN